MNQERDTQMEDIIKKLPKIVRTNRYQSDLNRCHQ